MTAARLIHTATEAEWLAARRAGVTASEIAVLMGLSPYSSPYALYYQKLGVLPELEETDAMALGKHMESFVAAKFTERHPEFWLAGDGRWLYAQPDRPWQMATPDRLVFERPPEWAGIPDSQLGAGLPDLCAVLECKIDGGSDEWGEDGSDQIPVHYRCQVLWQMDVMGVTTGYLACLLWQRRQVRVYELTLDAAARADLNIMRTEAWAFLDRIRFGDPPDVDWRPATSAALKRLYPGVEDRDVPIGVQLAGRYRAACHNYKKWEQRKRLYENRIREQLGNGHRAVIAGPAATPVARRDVYDVREHTRKASHVDKLVPVKPPAPKEKP